MSRRCGVWNAARAGVLGVVAFAVSPAAAADAPPRPGPEDELAAYMNAAIQLRDRWLRAGDLISKREYERASSLLSDPVPGVLSESWRGANADHLAFARSARTWGAADKAGPLLRMGACAASERTLATEVDPKVVNDTLRSIRLAQCYLGSGQAADARRVLEALEKVNSDPQFTVIPELIAAVPALPARQEPPPSFYVGECRRGWSGNGGCAFWPVIRAWQLRAGTPSADDVLIKLLSESRAPNGDRDRKAYELALMAVARSPRADRDLAAAALNALAHEAHAARRTDQAMDLWREITSQHPNTRVWGAATYNLGLLLRRAGRCGEALPIFDKLIASGVNDRERGSHLMETSRNYRPRAQWNITLCKLSSRDYPGALAAVRTLRTKYPVNSWCGNEQEEWDYRYDLYEGLSLEYLGRVQEAVVAYVRATDHSSNGGPEADDRLVALYAASGQIADLRRIAAQTASGHPIEGVTHRLRLMDLEQKRAWPELVQMLLDSKRRGESDPAMQAIARHGDDLVPLLLAEADKPDKYGRSNPRVWQALGRAVTRQTVASVTDRARREKDNRAVEWLIGGLALSGEAGRAALAALGREPPNRDEDQDRDKEKVIFPPLPTKQRLPASVPPPPKPAPVDDDRSP